MTSFTDRSLLYLYAAALFVSAALLFLIQPMIAKMILPALGGSPAVWNTCLFFFQSLLLLGYLYAHLGNSILGVKRHMILHLMMVGAALYFLPVALPPSWSGRVDADPVTLVLGLLLVSVGFPFFVLSANAPLLQKWFSTTGHAHARDPYFLYAASNAGSLLGLIAYPLLLEPRLSLVTQSRVWMYAYIGFLLVAVVCGWRLRRAGFAAEQKPDPMLAPMSAAIAGRPALFRRLRWLVLSFAPSSLLLGVTTYVTTDLASVPLLWVLPLSLYLMSFIIAFHKQSWASTPFLVKRQGFLLLAAAITFFSKATEPAAILLPLHLLAFFVTGLVCHGELAKARPEPQYLTEYYLWISFGGLLGGFFNALLAPMVFSSVLEYPLAMIAAAWVRPGLGAGSDRRWLRIGDALWPAALFLIVFALVWWTRDRQMFSAHVTHLLIFGVAALIGLSFARRPTRFALGIMAILLATIGYTASFGDVLFTERSFFGVYRALRDSDHRFHFIFHGTTLHGAQSLTAAKRLEPLSYFHRTGPAGQVFNALQLRGFDQPVAIVGLGAGALACYGKPGQAFDFYEIDPLVERIARNEKLFTFMRDCPPRAAVRIGDARVTLNRAADGRYGLLILDAFSGDSIPIHLLTQEAIELYLTKIRVDGLLLLHISNRYFDLTQVVAQLAQRLTLTALAQYDIEISQQELAEGKQPSLWVVLAPHKQRVAPFAGDPRWKVLAANGTGAVWTDNYSNILQVLRW